MATYLLTWNPKRWNWPDLEEAVLLTARGTPSEGQHSTGNNRTISTGDRLFLLKQGTEPRGIMAAGQALSNVFEGPHWDRSRPDDIALRVRLEFETILDPSSEDLLSVDQLRALPIPPGIWRTQASGVTIPAEAAAGLELLWQEHIKSARQTRHARLLFVAGRTYRRRELHERFSGQSQGGISTPARHSIVLLFTGESGNRYGYADGIQEDGSFWFFGEGQRGNMEFTKGNLAIRDHKKNGKSLHLFEQITKGQVRYIGQATCVGHHQTPAPDVEGDARQAIVFHLSLASEYLGEIPPTLEKKRLSLPPGLWRKPLAELRELASNNAPAAATVEARLVNVRIRSQAVKVYVLRRANGVCEGCGMPAPFKTKSGEFYLEPHHLRRLADDGPDHPLWVAAICPNCHARAHYGEDGEAFNNHLTKSIRRAEEHTATFIDR